MLDAPSSLPLASERNAWFPPAVVESFLRIRRTLNRRRYSQVDYLSRKFQKQFPAYAGYYLDLEARAHKCRGHTECTLELLTRANTFFGGTIKETALALGREFLSQDKLEEAEDALKKALASFPDDEDVQIEYCSLLSKQGQYREAIKELLKLSLNSENVVLWNDLGTNYLALGLFDTCIDSLKKAVELNKYYDIAWCNLVFFSHYNPSCTEETFFEILQSWKDVCKEIPRTDSKYLERRTNPDKKIRIGIVSAGLHRHPVGWMSADTFSMLARLSKYELYFYDTATKLHDDNFFKIFRTAATKWQRINVWDNTQLRDKMLRDKLDIAIDMCGHTEGSRLPVFASRVAPVQVKWVGGLCNSSGVTEIDYLLTDRFETPDGVDRLYAENLIRLPNSYIAYTPNMYFEVEPEPRPEESPVCFGCFNNAYKINPAIAGVWSEILRRVPDSTLCLKSFSLQQDEKREVILKMFTDNGISEDRLRIEGGTFHDELLKSYNHIDISLDPWPYNGGLTTLESIWMGVPVVTTPGPSFAGRHATSHLSNLGLESLVADSFEDYIDIAVKLATDRKLLTDLRVILPYTLLTSAISSPVQLAADLDTAFRTMWRRHCDGLPPVAMRFEQESPIPPELLPYATDGYLTSKLEKQDESQK